MSEGFMFDGAAEALAFFERCAYEKAETVEARMAILKAMVEEKKARHLSNVEGFSRGHNVLKIENKETPLE